MSIKTLKQVIVCGVITGMLASAMSCSGKKTGTGEQSQTLEGVSSDTSGPGAAAGATSRGTAGLSSKTWDGKGVAPKDAGVTLPGGQATAGGASAGSTEPEGPTCFTMAFTHRKLMSHSSEETCSHHKNVLKLASAKVNAKSICVRVNGSPVPFQQNKKDPSEIMIGAVAGPDAKITARYCVGKSTCKEDCAIPRDSFMDAIGGSDDMAGTQIGQWDAETDEAEAKRTAKLNADLKKELSDLDESAPGTSEGLSIFKDWVGDAEIPACRGTQQAQATDSRS